MKSVLRHAFLIHEDIIMTQRKKGIVEMLICATLWSIAGIFMKMLPWNGFAVASLRSMFAGLTIAAYMIISKIRLNVNRKTVISGLMTGCVYTCFACANKLTTAANAIVLQFTSPVFIVIFSALFYRKKIDRLETATVILTLAGILLFFLDKVETGYIFGNIVAIAAGMFMAGMFMTVGNLEGGSRFNAVLIGQMFTFLIGLPFVLTTHPLINPTTLGVVALLGVFQLGIAYILYIKASESCPPLACCLLGVIEPLLNPVWVMIFDGETPGLFAFIGGIIVIITVTVYMIKSEE